LNTILIFFSAISFLVYGTACFFSSYMRGEFNRYHLGAQRKLIGGLQLLAVLGLLTGFYEPAWGRFAAIGLALMMLVAVGVRIKIKDSFLQTIPAMFYLALNIYLSLAAF
jgi:hypothetical protein